MTRGVKTAVGLLAVLVVIFVGFRIVRPREGTRSVSIGTSAAVLKTPKLGAQVAVNAARTRCKDPNGPLGLLGVRGPMTVVVRETAGVGSSVRFSVNCETRKATALRT